MRTGPSTPPVPATRPAQTWTRRWSMRRSRHSTAPASPTSTSAVRGSTGTTPPSPRSPRSTRPRWSRGRSRSSSGCSMRRGMRGVVIVSGVAYGDGGGGVPGLLLGSPRDDAGNLIMLGTGQQHWSTVHVADLADFFRRVLEDDSARGYYVVGDGLNPTVAELTEAAAVAAGAPGAVPGSDDEARARLGDYFAEVLLLDQGTDAAKARAELGWSPSHPGLVDEFRHGSYRTEQAERTVDRHVTRGGGGPPGDPGARRRLRALRGSPRCRGAEVALHRGHPLRRLHGRARAPSPRRSSVAARR